MAYLELTARQTELHARALRLSREHRELEAKLCECLREIDETKLFKKLEWPSLFIYATRELGLTEAIAYAFISVARKSREIPELKVAIEEKTLSVAKASRMVSGLSLENAGELIDFAKTRSTRELEAELARRNPERPRREQVRFIDGDSVELRAYLPKSAKLKLERVTALLAQKGKPINLATAIESALDEYLKRHDPVEKARRAEARAARRCQGSVRGESSMTEWELALAQGSALSENPVIDQKPAQGLGSALKANSVVGHEPALRQDSRCENTRSMSMSPNSNLSRNSRLNPSSNSSPSHGLNSNSNPNPNSNHHLNINNKYLLRTRGVLQKRISSQKQPSGHKPASLRRPLSASEKHAVFLRDEGRCTFVNEQGERCGADRYLHVHHIKMVSHGGTNEPSNTTTLCAAHHDLVHQLSFPIERQINWLRARVTEYVA
jgi:hypothetical protein